VIAADPGSVGEGLSIYLRREHLFTPRAFTSLMVNQAIVKAFDGVRVLEPWVVYLKPMHENPELSWFDTTGKATESPGPQAMRRARYPRLLRQIVSAAKAARAREPVAPRAHNSGPATAATTAAETSQAGDQVLQHTPDSTAPPGGGHVG
jgi:hypothetical protein